MVTVWPAVIDTLSSTTSVPLVPTVSPVITSLPLLSRMRAAAAVPLALAEVSDFGKPESVSTAPEMVPLGSFSVISARMVAMPVVPICRMPAPVPASIWSRTAVMRAVLVALL